MAETRKDKLDKGNANNLPSMVAALRDPNATTFAPAADANAATDQATQGFGSMMRALGKPSPARTRTGLTSGVSHAHDVSSHILSVESPVGTPLAIISGGTPGAGEVSVDEDATTGVPTLEFAGAVTTYTVRELGPLPQAVGTVMDVEP